MRGCARRWRTCSTGLRVTDTTSSIVFRDFSDVEAHLDSLGMFHMDLGLSRVEHALASLGLTDPPFKVVHVVGTNGKGSTSRCIAALAREHGYSCGLYGSPHFLSPRERVLVNDGMLPGLTWAKLGNEVLAAAPLEGLTYFEFITVLAVLAFARSGVDVAVMEAGLGGRYDAANAMRTDLTVFTPIGMDHEQVLGGTLAEIADDKAGAMRSEVPVVSAAQRPEAARVLQKRAENLGTSLVFAGDQLHGARPAMAGPHQMDNARLAVFAFERLMEGIGRAVDPACVRTALAGAVVPGRFQRIGGEPEVILDGAHNVPALECLAATLEHEGIAPAVVVFGCMADKDISQMGPLVMRLTQGPVIACGLPELARAMEPSVLAESLGERSVPARDIAEAMETAAKHGGPILVCGSLYLLGEYFTLNPDALPFVDAGPSR